MNIDDFLRMTRERGSELLEALGQLRGAGSGTRLPIVGDILGEYAGINRAPLRSTDQQIDSLVSSGSHYELLRGNSAGSFSESFMQGTSGYSQYDEGGVGHYFSIEAFDSEDELRRFTHRSTTLDDPPLFQAAGFGQARVKDPSEKTILRGAISKDSKIVNLQDLLDEVANLRGDSTVGTGELAAFRQRVVDSGDSKALEVFDAMFHESIAYDKRGGFAGILTGVDAYTSMHKMGSEELTSGGNELVVLNRNKMLAAEPRTLAEHQSMYPSERIAPNARRKPRRLSRKSYLSRKNANATRKECQS